MKKPVRRLAATIIALFTVLVINLNVIQVFRADSLAKDPSNTRVLLDEYQHERGAIVVDGKAIAMSEPTDDKLKYLRVYSEGPMYAPVTGYYSFILGNAGIEKTNDAVLAGTDDRLVGTSIADLFSGRDPRGGNVVLTLNSAAQTAAYQALVDSKVTGAVVALDPKTGAVLAMASTPTYDPNKLSSHDGQAIQDAKTIIDKPESGQPLLNRPLNTRYPPGSIFKIIDAAAALEKGLKPDDKIPAPDSYVPPGTSKPINNFDNEKCGFNQQDTLINSFTISCNTSFAKMAVDDLGESRLREMAAKFGINDTGWSCPLAVSPSTVGDIPDQPALAQSAIGQRDVQLTPMQAAMLAATVANNGVLMKPYLVAENQAPDLSILDKAEPEPMFDTPAFSNQTAQYLKQMMVSVVENGTGKKAQIPGVAVGGKTGTAEVSDGVSPHAWFTGFAPADNPKIAVAVFIQNGGDENGETHTGGDISAPIAKQVMEAYLNATGGGN